MMRRLFFVGMLFAMSGCAPRDVTYYYYPGLHRNVDSEAHLRQLAEKHCTKYGMTLVPYKWRGWSSVGQETETFTCQEHPAGGRGFFEGPGPILLAPDQLPD